MGGFFSHFARKICPTLAILTARTGWVGNQITGRVYTKIIYIKVIPFRINIYVTNGMDPSAVIWIT